MLNRFTVFALAAAGVLLSQGTIGAQPSGTASSTTAGGSSMSSAAQHFVMETASDGLAEVRLGQMAQEKASSEQVKQFGQRMVQDHTQSNSELVSIASQKGITPPSELTPEHQEMVDKLSKLSGEEFDRAYMAAMVKDHTKAVEHFEHLATAGHDPQLKSFAAKNLPILREHLDMAQSIASKQKGGS